MSNKTSDKNVGSIEEDIKILENLKSYLNLLVYEGKDKIIYNDLLWDEKTVDCINAIEHLLSDYTRQKQINKEHQKINGELREKVKELEEENEELLEVKISVSAENTIQNLKRENIKLEERCFIAEGNLKTTKEELRDYFYNSIPIQKIKNKIDEIIEDKDSKYYYEFLEFRDIQKTIDILSELLQEEDK